MSRSPTPAIVAERSAAGDASTGTCSGIAGTFFASEGIARSAALPHGRSSAALESTFTSRRRDHAPDAPGRLTAAGESKRTAYGPDGFCISAAVTLE